MEFINTNICRSAFALALSALHPSLASADSLTEGIQQTFKDFAELEQQYEKDVHEYAFRPDTWRRISGEIETLDQNPLINEMMNNLANFPLAIVKVEPYEISTDVGDFYAISFGVYTPPDPVNITGYDYTKAILECALLSQPENQAALHELFYTYSAAPEEFSETMTSFCAGKEEASPFPINHALVPLDLLNPYAAKIADGIDKTKIDLETDPPPNPDFESNYDFLQTGNGEVLSWMFDRV